MWNGVRKLAGKISIYKLHPEVEKEFLNRPIHGKIFHLVHEFLYFIPASAYT